MFKKQVVRCALVAVFVCTPGASRATAGVVAVCTDSFAINSFDAFTNVALVGDAQVTAGLLRLTPAQSSQRGGGWLGDKVHVAPGFDTTFTFRISSGTADGLALVIQDDSMDALGGSGSAMGYGPGFDADFNFHPGISRSVAIEIDTFGCCGELDAPHLSIQTHGINQNDPDDDFSIANAAIPEVADGEPHVVRVVYAPGSLRVLLDHVEYINTSLNLEDILGNSILDEGGCAWMGFTAATGGAVADQDILSWTLGQSCVQQFDLADFSSNPVSLAGSALVDGSDRLVLTPAQSGQAGSAWYASKAHVADGFETTFTFNIADGISDGFAFVIQDESNVAIGGSGSGLGYGNDGAPGITRSVAIEFDTFSFGQPGELDAPHVSLQTDGMFENSALDVYSLANAAIPPVAGNGEHTVRIEYAQQEFHVWLDDVLYLSTGLDLQDVFGDSILDQEGCAWIGFTAGTGGAVARQEIASWSFSTSTCANPPCERQIVAWRSLRLHGVDNLGIDLDPNASGNGANGPTVEPRSGGIQEFQIEFDQDVTPADLFGAVIIMGQTSVNGVLEPPVQYFYSSAGTGGPFISLYFDPGQLPDQTCYTITIEPTLIEETPTGDLEVQIRSLEGDVTGDGRVTLTDIIHVQQQATAGVTATDAPQFDCDLSGGTIDSVDVQTAKAQVASPAHEAQCAEILIQ